MTVLAFLEEREQRTQNRRKVVLDGCRDDVLETDAPLDAFHALVERRQRHDRLDPHRVEHPLELALGVRRIGADDHSADLPRAELCDQELRTVGEQQRDAIPLANTQTRQRGRESIALGIELAVGHGRALEKQRSLVGVVTCERRQVVDEGAIGIRSERVGDVVVVVRQPGLHGGILQAAGSGHGLLSPWPGSPEDPPALSHQHRQQRLLCVESVLGLIEDHRRR